MTNALFPMKAIDCLFTGLALVGSAWLAPPQISDVVLTQLTYSSGPLGAYYQPAGSPLLNAGSRSAAEAGLFHHTVLAGQTKAGLLGNGQVSIGYHYVAVDATGQPLDTDADGLADYVEDADGKGSWDGWPAETDWMNPDTDQDGLPDGVDADPWDYDFSPPVFVITAPAQGVIF